MRHYFVLDHKDSRDFNTFLASSNMFDGAERDVTTVEIPGRNGTLTLDNGRYRNFSGSLLAYVPRFMMDCIPALRAFLASRHQYVRYEDSMHPEEYREVRFSGGFKVEKSDRVAASVALTFDCKPQRFLKSGEIPIEVPADMVLYNETFFEARPLIRVNGSGTITINDISVTLSDVAGEAEIDCSAMEVPGYNDSTQLDNGEFPVLKTGENAISFRGFSSVVIIPRWYTI